MKRLLGFFFVILALGTARPAFAWQLNDSEEPGSVLVFPRVHTGTVTAPDGIFPRTRFEISVTCPQNFDCSGVGTVFLRAHWVCGGNASNVCQEVDFNLQTTINGTINFNTENIGPRTTNVPAPPNCPSDPAEEGKHAIFHHTDHVRTNNDPANLAVLCHDCHSRVEGDEGLGRRFTTAEVREYKKQWEAHCSQICPDEDESEEPLLILIE